MLLEKKGQVTSLNTIQPTIITKSTENHLDVGGLYIFTDPQNLLANQGDIEILDRVGSNAITIISPSFYQGVKLEGGKYVIVYNGSRVFYIDIDPNEVNMLLLDNESRVE